MIKSELVTEDSSEPKEEFPRLEQYRGDDGVVRLLCLKDTPNSGTILWARDDNLVKIWRVGTHYRNLSSSADFGEKSVSRWEVIPVGRQVLIENA